MALKEFKLPDIGEGIAEGEIVSWKVEVGQSVKEEDEFVEVMTDKATVTITAPFDGVVKELRAKEGDVVPVESVIAVFEVGGADAGKPAQRNVEEKAAAPEPARAAAGAPAAESEPRPEAPAVITPARREAPARSGAAFEQAEPGKVL